MAIAELSAIARPLFYAATTRSNAYGTFRRLWEGTDGKDLPRRIDRVFAGTDYAESHNAMLVGMPPGRCELAPEDEVRVLHFYDATLAAMEADKFDFVEMLDAHRFLRLVLGRIILDCFKTLQKTTPRLDNLPEAERRNLEKLIREIADRKRKYWEFIDEQFDEKRAAEVIVALLRICDWYRGHTNPGGPTIYVESFDLYFGPNGTIANGRMS